MQTAFSRRLVVKLCRRSTLLFLLFWFACWLLVNAFLFVHQQVFSEYCTDEKSRRILERLCADYRQGYLMGDICEDICVTQKVVYKNCLYYNRGKRVIEADWQGRTIILKSKWENFSNFEKFDLLDDMEMQEIPDADLLMFVALELKSLLGLELKNTTVPHLIAKQLADKNKHYSKAELDSMWALLQQEEYLFFRVLQDLSKHVLEIVGSCGHFYAVQYLTAGHAWHQNLFSLEDLIGSDSVDNSGQLIWQAINSVALSFLDMVRQFDNDFSYRLHLCDVKPENFGIQRDFTVVAIDVDMAFFEPKMQDILEQSCTTDEDCSFFDCFSKCNLRTNKCGAERENTNLQVICDKIFRRWFAPSLIGPRVSLPLQIKLQQAVQRCATPSKEENRNRKATQNSLLELYALLEAHQKELQQ
ncbi:divergent protein kinase domain 1C [Protopterus annectens]|uniref:divergent protein kinase domain 1C n=1 Tax=Protopterus annectens TaxID=7888 RepID=UPI001CFB227B|nr:divergent protein kinase domain 1C [Protopterus annectens]